MRRPPPISEAFDYPVTGGIVLLAIFATVAAQAGRSIEPLTMSYLAFHGQPWRLITCAFPHVGWLHLIFNAYWIWTLGSVIESYFGHIRTGLLYLLLAVGSAVAEYAFSTGGVGLSGVNYGVFGFLWILGRLEPRWADAVDKATAQTFVVWFFVCIVLTATNVMPVGNWAHGVGAILGALVGGAVAHRPNQDDRPRRSGATFGAVVLLLFCTWAATFGRPLVNYSRYGGQDLERLAYDALQHDDNQTALRLLKIATSMRRPSPDAWHNLGVTYSRLGQSEAADQAFAKAGPRQADEEDSPTARK